MKTIQRTIRILSVNLKEILLFEIIYRLVAGVMFFSLVTREITLAIKYSGYSYLTAKNIGFFLMKPFTIFMLLLIVIEGIILLVIESASLLAAFQAGERCEKLPSYRIFIRGVKKCRFYLKKKNFYVIGMNFFLVLVFHYGLISKGIAHIKPASDLVKTIGQSTVGSGLLVFLAVLVIFLFLPGLYTIHFGILNKKSEKEAWKESWRLVSRHTISAVLHMLFLNLILYLIFRFVLILLTVVSALIIYNFVSKSITLALFLTTYNWLEVGCLLAASILNSVSNWALLTGLYYTMRDKEKMAPELLVSEEEEQWSSRKTRRTWKILEVVWFAFFCVFLYDVVENGIRFAREALVETEITAHRGSSVEAPENTLEAIELAIEQMANYVEIDVQESLDGEIILLHDKSFKRTCGINKNPWSMTLEEIKNLNAANYMSEYEYAAVPTLREVLESCKDKVSLNIELKNNGHDEGLPDKVVALVKEYDMENQCVFTSTSITFLKRVKEIDEELKTGYILSTVYGEFYTNNVVDFFSVNSALLDEKNIALSHENGKEIHAWTVNSRTEMERLKHLGVDNIITDYPVLTREILYREEDTENFIEFLSMVLN